MWVVEAPKWKKQSLPDEKRKKIILVSLIFCFLNSFNKSVWTSLRMLRGFFADSTTDESQEVSNSPTANKTIAGLYLMFRGKGWLFFQLLNQLRTIYVLDSTDGRESAPELWYIYLWASEMRLNTEVWRFLKSETRVSPWRKRLNVSLNLSPAFQQHYICFNLTHQIKGFPNRLIYFTCTSGEEPTENDGKLEYPPKTTWTVIGDRRLTKIQIHV